MAKIAVIGSGMGGLAAALRLQHLGHQVTVFEKGERPGGRSNVIERDGFRVDTGPTILVMRDAFEDTYRAVGESLDDRLDLVQLDPNYRLYFQDGDRIDLHANMGRLSQELDRVEPAGAEKFFRFLGEAARKYELGMDFVVRNYDGLADLATPSAGIRLLRTKAHQNLYRQVSSFFESDKLRQAFSFHSMFLGLSPYDALAMYSLITYADLARGMWYPRGGIYSMVEDMVAMAEERGVVFRLGESVEEIMLDERRVTGVRTANGQFSADLVVSNADLPYTYRRLLPSARRYAFSNDKLDRMDYACSGYLLYLGVDRTYEHLAHQGLFFSKDYKGNLDAIFGGQRLPEDPSFHLNVPTVTDPSLAPAGHSLLYVLAPMPNLDAPIDWQVAGPHVRDQLLDKLETIVDPQLRKHIVWEQSYRPTDFEADFNAVKGTAFGSLSHGFFQSSTFRPHNKAAEFDGLYFVGQGTYPGIGMPMVHLSARLVTERIMQEWN
ncbi:MAG: phytoene desaturase family protein [Anaerolineales bacterium]